jgi:pentapeptide repeat protein
MNLATLSGRRISQLRLEAVTCDPPLVEASTWTDVHIQCRTKTQALRDVTFRGCEFENTYFGNAPLDLAGVAFERCTFREVTFMYGQLRGAVFVGGALRNSYFRSADLRDAAFRQIVLRKVSFEKANLTGCRFEGVTLQKMDMWGWHGYPGAIMPDEQRYEFYETTDPGPRLRAAVEAGLLGVPAERVVRFIEALEAARFSTGSLTLTHREWQKAISLADFAALGRFLTNAGDAAG